MKELIALILALILMLTGTAVFAEDTEKPEEEQTEVEKTVEEMTTSEEEEAYREYFKSAFEIVSYTRNVSVNISNFLYFAYTDYDTKTGQDYSFLLEIQSPLELTSEQLQALYIYRSNLEENKSYSQYIDSTMHAAMNINRSLPAYLTVFSLLEKPAVPEKYAYVDSCIDAAIAEAQTFYDGAISFLSSKSSVKPSYDTTYFEYLELVNDLL